MRNNIKHTDDNHEILVNQVRVSNHIIISLLHSHL